MSEVSNGSVLMPCTLEYSESKIEERTVHKVRNLLIKQASKFHLPYYVVLYYGKAFRGNSHDPYSYFLDPEEYRKRWDRGQIRSTHNFISKQLKKCFGDIPQFWFINRHNPKRNPSEYSFELNDPYDPRAHSEYTPLPTKTPPFQTDLYIGQIPDEVITTPSEGLKRLIHKMQQSSTPINISEVGIEGIKPLLLDACIRQAKWVGDHPNSVHMDDVPREEFGNAFDYGLKDLLSLDDLNDVVDFPNSYFYNPKTQERIK